ncbi:MAG TPA: PEP-CTERM sorting domain-containing protein [Gammaproteobacteria bacterium]|nr:PEP-CTERM sorting domain-containing protein [Gammaproteobacteria bacterium]
MSSTAAQVAQAVNASPAAGSLVQASLAGSGTGVVQSQSVTALAPAIVEAGPFAGSYGTSFANSPGFPQDAAVSYGSGAAIAASSLFLYVRDTNQQPAFYIYDLLVAPLSWNGLDSLLLRGFWPNEGSIEQLKIVGLAAQTTPVPEGSSLALLVAGLGALAGSRRTRRSAK